MDENQKQDQPAMSNDDELAKTLSGGLQFDELPVPGGDDSSKPGNDTSTNSDDSSGASDTSSKDDTSDISFGDDSAGDTAPTMGDLPKPVTADSSNDDSSASPSDDSGKSDLEKLKAGALDDLRPLVGKLNLSPEEKFDTLLLIIRSTDDQALLAEAHATAKEISDETKRAQALLDVIKEVDYFSKK